jgi:23S rRNA pseudouridine2605 synthase
MARPFKKQPSPRPLTIKPPAAEPGAVKSSEAETAQPPQRLHKLLALSGLGSRRDMEALIASGRITINGVTAVVGVGVVPGDIVRLDSRPLRLQFEAELPKVLLYHKPEGEIVSQDDPEGRATVFDKLPRVKNAKWIAIGRLDINTSGLLIFTTSGELANHFMHPRYEVEREYAVRIFGELSEGQLLQLTQGMELDDGPANFDVIHPLGGEGSNHWYKVALREGRNREVRRLFEAFQLPVSRLMRVRFGPINLPPRLKRGMMMELEPKEVVNLLEWAGLEGPKGPLRQRTAREIEKASNVFSPKARKAPSSREGASRTVTGRIAPEYSNAPADGRHGAGRDQPAGGRAAPVGRPVKKAGKPAANRRVRQTSDLSPPRQQKRSDRNRGRG